jgi:hypothetical protein
MLIKSHTQYEKYHYVIDRSHQHFSKVSSPLFFDNILELNEIGMFQEKIFYI